MRTRRYAPGSPHDALHSLVMCNAQHRSHTLSLAWSAHTQAIKALNDKIMADDRVHVAMLSNSDGISLCYKK